MDARRGGLESRPVGQRPAAAGRPTPQKPEGAALAHQIMTSRARSNLFFPMEGTFVASLWSMGIKHPDGADVEVTCPWDPPPAPADHHHRHGSLPSADPREGRTIRSETSQQRRRCSFPSPTSRHRDGWRPQLCTRTVAVAAVIILRSRVITVLTNFSFGGWCRESSLLETVYWVPSPGRLVWTV